jgi:hypothetical protein
MEEHAYEIFLYTITYKRMFRVMLRSLHDANCMRLFKNKYR